MIADYLLLYNITHESHPWCICVCVCVCVRESLPGCHSCWRFCVLCEVCAEKEETFEYEA